MTPVTLDCETHPISPEQALPKVVCMGVAIRVDGEIVRQVFAGRAAYEMFRSLLLDDDVLLVNLAMCYDLAVMFATYGDEDEELITLIFRAFDRNRITDVGIREKLITLATYGDLEYLTLPDGTTKKTSYNLGELRYKYLGVEREKGRMGDDTWRTNFHLLDGRTIEEYPQDAIEYVEEDVSDPLEIYELQEALADEDPVIRGTLESCQYFRTMADFCLKLISSWGFLTDEEFKAELQKKVDEEYLSNDCMPLLIKHGLVTPAQPSRPYANGAKHPDGTPKMTKPETPTRKMAKIRERVVKIANLHDIPIQYTDPSDKHPEGQVSAGKEMLTELEGLDPILDEYMAREKLAKLATTELPRMSGGPIVRPNFDVLKKTGRISSFAGKNSPYPAFNAQNVDPRARGAFVARPGHVFVSIDYAANELVAAAQVYLRVVGWSVLADVINAGIDTHAYLGAQIALYLDGTFRGHCEDVECKTAMDVYDAFKLFEKQKCQKCRECQTHREWSDHAAEGCLGAFYKHYRTLAKPTGLGYPGGLGPDTMVKYAKSTYGVEIDRETAHTLREIWRDTYPEVPIFFEWINTSAISQRDASKFVYETSMGMVRDGCSYTEAANGKALQSESAEWVLLATCRIVREQYDPSMGSCLLGTHVLAPIHDEIFAEIPEDEYMTDRALRMAQIMIEAGKERAPDLDHRAEPALMRRWDKSAECVWDEDAAELRIWEPRS